MKAGNDYTVQGNVINLSGLKKSEGGKRCHKRYSTNATVCTQRLFCING